MFTPFLALCDGYDKSMDGRLRRRADGDEPHANVDQSWTRLYVEWLAWVLVAPASGRSRRVWHALADAEKKERIAALGPVEPAFGFDILPCGVFAIPSAGTL